MWPQSDETRELLDLAKNKDASAIDQLMQRHRNSLRRLIQMRLDRRIQQRIDVSDIVQEVLIEANRRLQEYLDQPKMEFHLWLRQIARDRMIDAFRRHRGSAKRSLDREQGFIVCNDEQSAVDLATQLRDANVTPAAAALNHEIAQMIENAISKLNEQDGEMIVMRHYENLSNREVAQALDLTEPAASMRYLRAIRRLREVLDVKT